MKEKVDNELSLPALILFIVDWLKFFVSKWIWLILSVSIGLVIGFLVWKFSEPKYKSEITFVLEGGAEKSAGGLSAALGINEAGSSGLFSTINNIIWLYNSNKMIENALLAKVEYPDGSERVLINEFLNTSNEVKKYLKKAPKFKGIIYNAGDTNLTSDQKLLMRFCVAKLKEQYLTVEPVPKTDNIVNIKFLAEDELFAFYYSIELTNIVNDFYINTRTQKSQFNVEMLTVKADSLRMNLNNSMIVTASSVDNIPYLNPHLSVLKVAPQKSSIDVQANTSLYLQVLQNLENAKNELAKEKPIIQIVDSPNLPLTKSNLNRNKALLFGGIIGLLLCVIYLVLRKLIKQALAERRKKVPSYAGTS